MNKTKKIVKINDQQQTYQNYLQWLKLKKQLKKCPKKRSH